MQNAIKNIKIASKILVISSFIKKFLKVKILIYFSLKFVYNRNKDEILWASYTFFAPKVLICCAKNVLAKTGKLSIFSNSFAHNIFILDFI